MCFRAYKNLKRSRNRNNTIFRLFFFFRSELQVEVKLSLKDPCICTDEDIQVDVNAIKTITVLFENSTHSKYLLENVLPTFFPNCVAENSGFDRCKMSNLNKGKI